MTPKKFKEVNVTYAENQSQYTPLPVFKNKSSEGEVIACYNLSFKERVKLLFTGEIWLVLLTFNKPLTPSFITAEKSEAFNMIKSKQD